jgi:NitT/TauT family transport system substrate-binding protein
MKNWRSRAVLGPLCALALLGLGAQARAGDITIGHTVWVGYGAMYLARDLGYFDQAGLHVNLQVVDDNALAMAAEAGGRMDGSASTVDEILKYRSKNFCFKTVAVLDDSAGGDGIVATDKITSLKDLAGKQVAMNEGSTSQFWFSYVMKKEGLPLDGVTVANMSADDAAAAFIAGRVPAAVTWEPNLTLVRTKKAGHVLMDSRSIPGVIVDVVQLRCDVIEKHPADVQALVNGIYRAVVYQREHPDESNKIMAKGVGGYLSKPEDFADALKGVRLYDQGMAADYLGTAAKPGPVADVIKLGNEIWSDLGKMKQPIDYSMVIDPQFTDAAK